MPPVRDDVARTHNTTCGQSLSQAHATARYAVPVALRTQAHTVQHIQRDLEVTYAGLPAAPVWFPTMVEHDHGAKQAASHHVEHSAKVHLAHVVLVLHCSTTRANHSYSRLAGWVST